MKRELTCLRCGVKLIDLGQKEFQMGRGSMWMDTHRGKGSMELEVYQCPACGKRPATRRISM